MLITRHMLTKYLLSLDDLMHVIVISENMESVLGSAVHVERRHISDCSIRQHVSDTDNLFDDICNMLQVSSLETISTCKKHCAKTMLYLNGMITLRKRTLKLDIIIFYGVIWENLSMAQSVS